jgi:hypothetical protein
MAADTTITLPPSGSSGTANVPLVVDQDAAGNIIPASKLLKGAAGTNSGFVTESNPLPVGFQDPYGNGQQPTLKQVNGIWRFEANVPDEQTAAERIADAAEAQLAIWQQTPVGDATAPLAVQVLGPNGSHMPPLSRNYVPTGWQAIACTFAGLATSSQRQSAYINTSGLGILDALVMIEVRSAAAATSATGIVNVYAYGSFDGANFGDTVTGKDAAVTLTAPPNLTIIGTLNVVANATTYNSNPYSVASAFGGTMPPYWGVVVENKSGATLLAAGPTRLVWLGVY